MVIWLNGQEEKLDRPMSIKDLLQQLNLKEERIAVEVNLDIIDRQKFHAYELKDGDRVEVIRFVGGG